MLFFKAFVGWAATGSVQLALLQTSTTLAAAVI